MHKSKSNSFFVFVQIQQQKLQWNAKSKIGSLENAHHKPQGGDKKIETVKLDFKEKAKPKIGSKDNIKHVPGGGDVKVNIIYFYYCFLFFHHQYKIRLKLNLFSLRNNQKLIKKT